MKTIILFLSILALLTSSCSNSENPNPNDAQKILIKKATILYTDTNQLTHLSTYDYQYVGNKIVNIVGTNTPNGNYSYTFTYTGDLITKFHAVFSNTNTNSYTCTILYDSQNKCIGYNGINGTNDSASYVNNSDGSITGYNATGSHMNYFFTNFGDLSKTEYFESTISVPIIHVYTYDTANSPFKNITGNGWFINSLLILNNTSSLVHNAISLTDNTVNSTITNYTYTYNSSGYPITCSYPNNFIQYFYE